MEEIWKITDDTQADNTLEKIRDCNLEIERYRKIAVQKIEAINNSLELRIKPITEVIEFNKNMLQAYFLIIKPKSTKTQKTYGLLSGKLVLKNATQKIYHDDKEILKWANDEFIKKVPSLNWVKFKADIEVKNGLLISKTTGEIISGTESLRLDEIGEKFEVKL